MSFQPYAYLPGRSHPVSAQIVGEAIDRIAAKEGSCPPEKLVEEARPKRSPLHPLFTWDDRIAADKWRRHEARNVINSVGVRVLTDAGEKIVPYQISVGHVTATKEAGTGYRNIGVIVGTPSYHDEAKRDALSRLDACRRRFEFLTDLQPVWDAIEAMIDEETPAQAAD